ncbi:MAG TPA: hypothetical protein VM428_10985, partial [Microlunatus sp.]|nr:hypothetical protein [Microlunatus sp.]
GQPSGQPTALGPGATEDPDGQHEDSVGPGADSMTSILGRATAGPDAAAGITALAAGEARGKLVLSVGSGTMAP